MSLIWQQIHWMLLGLLGAVMVGVVFPLWGMLIALVQNMFYYPDTNGMRIESEVVAKRFIMLGLLALTG